MSGAAARFGTVLRRELRDTVRSRAAVLAAILVVVAAIAAVAAVAIFLGSSAGTALPSAARRTVVGALAIALGALPAGIAYPLLISEPLVRDRSSGAFLTLLATPVRVLELVGARAVALWLPTVPLAVLLPVSGYLVTASASPIPSETIRVLLPAAIAVPALMLALAIASVELGLVVSADTAVAPSYLLALVIIAGVPVLSVVAGLDPTSAAFGIGTTLVAVLAVLGTVIVGGSLTRERIARLSS